MKIMCCICIWYLISLKCNLCVEKKFRVVPSAARLFICDAADITPTKIVFFCLNSPHLVNICGQEWELIFHPHMLMPKFPTDGSNCLGTIGNTDLRIRSSHFLKSIVSTALLSYVCVFNCEFSLSWHITSCAAIRKNLFGVSCYFSKIMLWDMDLAFEFIWHHVCAEWLISNTLWFHRSIWILQNIIRLVLPRPIPNKYHWNLF